MAVWSAESVGVVGRARRSSRVVLQEVRFEAVPLERLQRLAVQCGNADHDAADVKDDGARIQAWCWHEERTHLLPLAERPALESRCATSTSVVSRPLRC